MMFSVADLNFERNIYHTISIKFVVVSRSCNETIRVRQKHVCKNIRGVYNDKHTDGLCVYVPIDSRVCNCNIVWLG